jgi:PAS domain S-box-containing protein
VSAEAAVPFLIATQLVLGSALAVLGLMALRDPTDPNRDWGFAWATYLWGTALALLSPSHLLVFGAALSGLSPALFLTGSLAFAGRPAPRSLIVLAPLGALLQAGLVWVGPATAPAWAVFAFALEGGAALVLYRAGSRDWIRRWLLPGALGLFAGVHVWTIIGAEPGSRALLPPMTATVVLLLLAQHLALQERIRAASQQSEHERRESEHRYRSLADLSNLVVLILDLDNRVVEWNRTAEAIYGWTRAEALGREYLETFLPEEVRPAIRSEIARIVAGGQAHGYENPVRTREGERILRWNVSRLQDDEGQPYGIFCVAEDVTDELAQRAEQRRLFAAVEQAGDAVVIADRRGVVVYANPAFNTTVEKDAADVLGHPIREVVHGWQDEKLIADILEHWSRGDTWKGRYETRWPDGRTFVRDATFAPVRGEDGEIAYVVAVLRDVTHEQELERELARSQKLTALGTLAGGIAHDFNNLLTAIIGGAHLLADGASPDETKETAEEILEAARRGASLSRQLLAFGRRQPLHTEVIDLDAVVAEMKALLERLIGEHIELTVESGDGLWRLTAERSQLEQVIMNLVLNARDAMPEGGRLSIRTANRTFAVDDPDRPSGLEPGEYVALSVVDTGVGMDEETRARAFEPFFTQKEPGAGTGLGLATVFGIARQSDGDVVLQSAPGQGSRVDVYLPRTQGPVSVPAPGEPRVGQGGSETILLVEDDALVRRIARRTLDELGYRVLEAEDGEAARALLAQEQDVDLLLTDIVMPGTSGAELAEELPRSHPDTRVLFISGYQDLRSDRPAGPLLEKPFTPDQLARSVREALS